MITSFFYFLAYVAVLVAGGYVVTRRWDDAPAAALMLNTDSMNSLTDHYNDAIRQLEKEYRRQESGSVWSLGGGQRASKRQFSQRYSTLAANYQQERKRRIAQWKASHPLWTKARTTWGWIFVIGLASGIVMCQATLLWDDAQHNVASAAMGDSGETTYWNADNIPIPYLQDSTQYVSNPDGVLAQNVVDSMNILFKQIEQQFDVQTVVAVVNHIENDDPFRMAQDLGNHYGVGRRDRGLVIVVGYGDHSINMSPGRALEADLTDAECHRLQQQYVVPAMRAAKPDSAMLCLTKALHAHLQKKELPPMSPLFDDDADDDNTLSQTMLLYMAFFIAWAMLFSRLNRKYQWLGLLGASKLLSDPFHEESSGGGGFFVGGGGGHGGGFSGGGFSGGSFGGGSFGGGGATSRW